MPPGPNSHTVFSTPDRCRLRQSVKGFYKLSVLLIVFGQQSTPLPVKVSWWGVAEESEGLPPDMRRGAVLQTLRPPHCVPHGLAELFLFFIYLVCCINCKRKTSLKRQLIFQLAYQITTATCDHCLNLHSSMLVPLSL